LQTKYYNKKVNIVSLGCSKNLVDSEVLMAQLTANSFQVSFENENDADIVVINTCGFINDAKEESIDTILQHVRAKEEGRIKKLYVMGCLAERYIKDLKVEIPDVDQYFGVNNIKEIISSLGGNYKTDLIGERQLTTPGHYAYLKISEGCNRNCTFCAIPIMRGKHKSKPIDEIIIEAKNLANKGVKELILIAQDLTYYGIDIYKKNQFAHLLETLSQLQGIEWIRLHYAYPAGFPLEALEVIKQNSTICKYIDIPVQHINNRILSLMQRGHSKEQTIELLEKIRKEIPDVSMRTTIIVGFPGETDEEFEELLDFINTFNFDRLGVFTYSPEEGTKAFKLPDNVPEKVKKERLEKIMETQQTISLKLNNEKVGRVFHTIIDRKEGNFFVGRSEFDSPEIDNEILIDSKNIELTIGSFYPVKIHHADYFDLYGTVSQI
jgi:ribosomal protein S12 methylthiotransferase